MTVSTLRPNATNDSSGISVTGAASAHAAANDNSDSSYVALEPGTDFVKFGMDDLTLPAGALIRNWAVRTRVARSAAGTSTFKVRLNDAAGDPVADAVPSVNWTSPTTITALAPRSIAAVTDADMDGAEVVLSDRVSGTVRVYEVYLDVTYVTQPTLNVTAPASPVTDTNFPTVVWETTLDADGGDVVSAQVRVFTAAEYGIGGFDPATSPATTETEMTGDPGVWQIDAALPDAVDYRAYVRVAQLVSGDLHWSAWDYVEFDVTVDLPGVPLITATAESVDGRIRIDLDDQAGDTTTTLFALERSIDGEATWEPVRTLRDDNLVEPTGGNATVYDHESPNGVEAAYRARALHDFGDETYTASAWTTPDTAEWESTDWWLKDPHTPARNIVLRVTAFDAAQRLARHGVFQALGATSAIVVSDSRGGATGAITLRTDTPAERDALDLLLGEPLSYLLQAPPADDEPDRWVRLGDHTRARLGGLRSSAPQRSETIAWIEVAAPADPVTAWAP